MLSSTKNNGCLQFTVYTNQTSGGYLAKQYDLIDNQIVKTPAANMYQGSASLMECTFDEFILHIQSADSNTAFGYGIFDPHRYASPVSVVTKRYLESGTNQIARTKNFLSYPQGHGILMLDYDPSEYGPSVNAQELLDILISIHPAIADAAVFVKPSISASVVIVGDTPKPSTGFHLYFPILDASDSARYGQLIHEKLWLRNHGFIALSKDGKMLDRSLIDSAVFSPERLDFVGKPVLLSDQLEILPPLTTHIQGNFLDTRSLPDLTQTEIERLKTFKELKKIEIEPDAIAKRETYKQNLVARLSGDGGLTQEQAEIEVNDMFNAEDTLYGHFILTFTDPSLGSVTVREVLANSQQYDQQTLADPIEGVAYGVNKAIFYWNNGKPRIHSFAHGNRIYLLKTANLTINPQSNQYTCSLNNLKTGFTDLLGGFAYFDQFKQEYGYQLNNGPRCSLVDTSITALRMAYAANAFQQPTANDVTAVLKLIGKENVCDSAQEALNGLIWDEIPRVATFFSAYFKVQSSDYVTAVSLYVWTTMVARILEPGCQADYMPIIIGDQGKGKSRGVKAMALNGWHTILSLNNEVEKNIRLMRGNIIAEIDELCGFRQAQVESIKSFVTSTIDSHVPKYEEFSTDSPRRAILMATTNSSQFLTDVTGNRRYLPIEVTSLVDVEKIQQDRDQLYAEAHELYKRQGGLIWEGLEELAAPILQTYMVEDPIEVEILSYMSELSHSNYGPTTKEIHHHLTDCGLRCDSARITKIMKKNGWRSEQRTFAGQRRNRWMR